MPMEPFIVVFYLIAMVVYIVPSIIAWVRGKRELPAIIALNIFGGLIMGIGWVGALVWALLPNKDE